MSILQILLLLVNIDDDKLVKYMQTSLIVNALHFWFLEHLFSWCFSVIPVYYFINAL